MKGGMIENRVNLVLAGQVEQSNIEFKTKKKDHNAPYTSRLSKNSVKKRERHSKKTKKGKIYQIWQLKTQDAKDAKYEVARCQIRCQMPDVKFGCQPPQFAARSGSRDARLASLSRTQYGCSILNVSTKQMDNILGKISI